MHPVAFHLGSLPVYWYGVMMALAFLVGLWTAGRRGVRDGLAPERVLDAGPWLIIGALVGARLFHVINYWEQSFAGKPLWEIFMIRHGGLVFYGGLIGAALGCIIYARLKSVPLWKLADVLSPSIALGYVFGRIGCLMNGCCYGRSCNLPWAISFPVGHETHQPGFPATPVHPTQVYESLLNVGLYLGLAWLYRRKKFDGQIFVVYLLGYAVLRSIVEIFRGDYSAKQLHFGLTPAHMVSIVVFAAGLALFWLLPRHRAARQ